MISCYNNLLNLFHLLSFKQLLFHVKMNPDLKQKTLLITRSPEGNRFLKRQIENCNGRVVLFSTFEYISCPLEIAEQVILKKLEQFDWIIFTSQNAVQFFFEEINCKNQQNLKQDFKIAAIGEKTGRKISEYGFHVDLIAKKNTAKDLAHESVFQNQKDLKILLPQAEDSRDEFCELLKNQHNIQKVSIYKKEELVIPQKERDSILRELNNQRVDWVLFYSPESFRIFLEIFPETEIFEALQNVKIASIGDTTTTRIQSMGFSVAVTSQKSTTEDLLAAISSYQ